MRRVTTTSAICACGRHMALVLGHDAQRGKEYSRYCYVCGKNEHDVSEEADENKS